MPCSWGSRFEETYKKDERSSPGGIRTFPMLAMGGATLYLIDPAHALAFVAGLLGLAAWLHAYLRAAPQTPEPPSFMIPASNLLAYVIGPIALIEPPWVAVAVTVAAVLLLGTRDRLHRLIHVVPREELITAGMFLILVGIILPLVPHQRVSSLTPLTPYGVWLAVVTVCTLSYLSYLLQRYAPIKNAALLPAVLGGAYSSTATTVVLAKRLREAKQAPAGYLGRHRGGDRGHVCPARHRRRRVRHCISRSTLAPALAALCAIGAALAIYEWRRPRTAGSQDQSCVATEKSAADPDRAHLRRAHRGDLDCLGLGQRRVR